VLPVETKPGGAGDLQTGEILSAIATSAVKY